MKSKELNIEILKKGLPAVTKSLGETLIEACNICYNSQNYKKRVQLKVNGEFKALYNISLFDNVTEQLINSWTDEQVTTEQGAVCIALVLILEQTEFTVIQRSKKGTRFDYWLGKKNHKTMPFDKKAGARLEVSGIRKGLEKDVERRVSEKIDRLVDSEAQDLPCYIVVIEFSNSISKVRKV